MLKYSYPALILHFIRADHYTQEQTRSLQRKKLKELVSYARERSPFFRELYKDIPEDFAIEDSLRSTRRL